MYYNWDVREVVWDAEHSEHMRSKHGVLVSEANQVLVDPDRVVRAPDPASRSGQSARVIGWCNTRNVLLTLIVVEFEGTWYGASGWLSGPKDIKRYEEEK
jgi:uncharacterized DUF497 family protein